MFDPFKDFATAGYLRNVRKTKDEKLVKHMEHAIFVDAAPAALAYLSGRDLVAYGDFLEVHRILFSEFYPWAGQDRATTTPDSAVKKGSVLFAHPLSARLAVEEGLRLGQDREVMNQRPGEVMGLFAYGHPFLDGNGRTMLLVHMELSHRAGFSIAWAATTKMDYLHALSQEIEKPGCGILDAYLLQFKGPQVERDAWGDRVQSIKGLDGLDDSNQVDGDLADPAVAEKYRRFDEQRGYSYVQLQSLAQRWKAEPARFQNTGVIKDLSDTEVIQDAGRGRYVVWDRRQINSAVLAVGKTVTIYPDGRVKEPSRDHSLGM